MNENRKLTAAASHLAEHGLSVFPVGIDKKSLTKWKRWQSEIADAEEIARMFASPKATGIAIACGKVSGGLEVIDFDVDGFYERWADACVALADGVPVQRTGGGGYQVAYRRPTPGRNSKLAHTPNEDLDDGREVAIETRGEGGYAIVPPSGHPSGGSYEYVGDLTFADAPTLTDAHADALLLAARKLCSAPVGRREAARRAQTATVATPVPRYNVDDGRSVIQAWNAAMPIEQMLSRCGYTKDPRSDEWTRPGPDASPGGVVILDGKSYHHSTNDLMSNGHANDSFELLVQYEYAGDVSAAVHGAALEMDFQQESSPVKWDFTELIANAERKKAKKPTEPELVALPEHLLQPPNLLGKICNWINSTASQYQPELALANAIPFLGTALGKKVRTPDNARTNFYTLGLAESCAGKNHSRVKINDLAEVSGMGKMLAGEDVTSDSAIMRIAKEQPACLLQMDEVGFFFKANSARGASSHEQKIVPTLMKAFTSAHTTLRGKEFSEGDKHPRIDVREPCINLYGTSVPGRVWSSLTPDQVSDGFLGRVLIFESPRNHPQWRDVEDIEPPKAIADAVSAWLAYEPPVPEGAGNLVAARPGAFIVPYTDAAKKLMAEFRDKTWAERKRLMDAGNAMHPLMGRAAEHATKLALLASMDLPASDMVIGVDAMRWATEVVWCVTVSVIRQAGDNLADTAHEREVVRVLSAIRKGGSEGVTIGSLAHSCRGIKSADRKAIVADLKESGQVTMEMVPTGGRPTVRLIAQ